MRLVFLLLVKDLAYCNVVFAFVIAASVIHIAALVGTCLYASRAVNVRLGVQTFSLLFLLILETSRDCRRSFFYMFLSVSLSVALLVIRDKFVNKADL